MDAAVTRTDEDKLGQLQNMTDFMNEKYDTFKKIWIEFDVLSMQLGVALAVYLFIFHQFVSFGKCQHFQDFGGIVGLSVSVTVYIGSLLGMYPLMVPAGVCLVVSWNQSWRQRNEYLRTAYSKVKRSTFTPKGIVYPVLILVLAVSFIVLNASDLLLQEQDYVIDSLLLICLGFMWVTQPSHLRKRDFENYIVVILCIKATYLCDNQSGLN